MRDRYGITGRPRDATTFAQSFGTLRGYAAGLGGPADRLGRGQLRFIQASDWLQGDFTEQDEANLVRLATLTSLELDALAQLHLPEYREMVRSL